MAPTPLTKAKQAKQASLHLANLTRTQKDKALLAIADALLQQKQVILSANKKDLRAAAVLVKKGSLKSSFYKRLALDEYKIQEMVAGLKSLVALPDPVGRTLSSLELDKGLELYQVSCPLGVVCFPFEARPELVIQGSSLCLKSGNAVLLKGGSEAAHTNNALYHLVKNVTENAKVPSGWIQLLETREELHAVFGMDAYVDLLVPRGSNAFVKYVKTHTSIPVLGHTDGICQIYIDRAADQKKAIAISIDAKCQYPAVCNSVENLLVHKDIAKRFLPLLYTELAKRGVEFRGCKRTQEIIPVKPATEKDWDTEYNDLILSIKVVDDIAEAIAFTNQHGSGHSDAIVTEDEKTAHLFLDGVDSSCVFWNASTRFSDGYRFGMGAEVGVSTFKTHARGPVGLEGLVIYKYLVVGAGHVVSTYTGKGAKPFTHRRLDKIWER